MITLAQIAKAALAEEARYEPNTDNALHQIASIQIESEFGGRTYYSVVGVTFRAKTSFRFAYAVEVCEDDTINVISETVAMAPVIAAKMANKYKTALALAA